MELTDHPYYIQSKKARRNFQVRLAFLALGINLLLGLLAFVLKLYLLPFVFIGGTLTLIAPFFDVPGMASRGHLTYHSSLFLAEKERKGTKVIHGGTLFDYYFVLKREWSSQERARYILRELLKGLINLIEEQEEKGNFHVKIKGTSYIINERTAAKIGLRKTSADPLQGFILLFNYFNLMASASLAKGRLAFPRLGRVNSFEAEIADLIARKDWMKALADRLDGPSLA